MQRVSGDPQFAPGSAQAAWVDEHSLRHLLPNMLHLPWWCPGVEVVPGSLARTGIAPGTGTSVGFPLLLGLASACLRWEPVAEGSWQSQSPLCHQPVSWATPLGAGWQGPEGARTSRRTWVAGEEPHQYSQHVSLTLFTCLLPSEVKSSLIFFCLYTSFFSRSFLWSQSGCRTRGTGFFTWRASPNHTESSNQCPRPAPHHPVPAAGLREW